MNMSLVTVVLSIILTSIGYFSPIYQKAIFNMGIFALSGSLTNWLAIHMLFEKVPGLYGSGIIPLKFESFKAGIKTMMMDQFFSSNNLEKFLSEQTNKIKLNAKNITDTVNFDMFFFKLKDLVLESQLGKVLGMFGGESVIDSLKEKFTGKIKEGIEELFEKNDFQSSISLMISEAGKKIDAKDKIEKLIDNRLNELTPNMVKEIIQKMIQKHLGWLVVWGGFFGAIIGLLSSFVI